MKYRGPMFGWQEMRPRDIPSGSLPSFLQIVVADPPLSLWVLGAVAVAVGVGEVIWRLIR